MKLSLMLKCEGLFEYLTACESGIALIIKVKMLCCIDVCEGCLLMMMK